MKKMTMTASEISRRMGEAAWRLFPWRQTCCLDSHEERLSVLPGEVKSISWTLGYQ